MKKAKWGRVGSCRIVFLVAALTLVMALGAWAVEKPDAKPTTRAQALSIMATEGKPAYTKAEAQSYVDELVPLVEHAAGRKFRRHPEIRLVTRKEMIPVLRQELTPQFRRQLSQLSGAQLQEQTDAACELYSMCLLGKYGMSSKLLYLVPGNVSPIMKISGTEKEYVQPMIKLVIAHEMMHALQDQEVGLGQLIRRADTAEKSTATAATFEGQAVFIQDRVAESLKLDKAAQELGRLMSAGVIKNRDKADEIMNGVAARMYQEIYLSGRDFALWQYQHGGTDRLWQVLANPPLETSVIYRPETYGTQTDAKVDYAAVLKGIETRFGKRKWTVQNVEVGEIGLRSLYADMDAEARDKILTDLEHAQALAAVDGYQLASVCVMKFRNQETGPLLIRATEVLARRNYELLAKSKSAKTTPITTGNFLPIKADLARKVTFGVGSPGAIVPVEFVRVARGHVVLEFCMSSVKIADKDIAAIAEEVFTRLSRDSTPK